MMTNTVAERRQKNRIPMNNPVFWGARGLRGEGRLLDLSDDGAVIQVEDTPSSQPPLGQELHIWMNVGKGLDWYLSNRARVIRCQHDNGGVRFAVKFE